MQNANSSEDWKRGSAVCLSEPAAYRSSEEYHLTKFAGKASL